MISTRYFERISQKYRGFDVMCNKKVKSTTAIASVFLILFIISAFAACAGAAYLSPVAVEPSLDKSVLYIAEYIADKVAVFDVASEAVVYEILLPAGAKPTGLALSPNGIGLYVASGVVDGKVYVVDTATKEIVDVIAVGHSPVSPVIDSSGNTLTVCNRFDNTVSIINIATKAKMTIGVGREPVASAITPDGQSLLVANLLPEGSMSQAKIGSVVSVIDLNTNTLETSIQLPNGSVSLQGICVSGDGQFAYVTHLLAKYHIPTNQIERGWIYSNAMSIIDISGKALLNTILLDDLDLGAANPNSVACTDDGKYVCVTHAGTHEITVIDRTELHSKLAGKTIDEVSRDFGFSVLFRRRLALKGNGPRGLVLIGTRAYAAEYFSGSLAVVDIDPDVRPKAKSISLGAESAMTDVRKGEMLYHDGQYCFQKWLSCASCHPGARADALNWDVLNDGFGNAKQTKSHLYSHQTPPTTITGCRADAETSVRAGLKYVYFAVRPESDAVAIDEYLKSLRPVPSPYLVDGQFSEAAIRGKAIFEGSADCASCHVPATYYSDMQFHDVNTGFGRHLGTQFDTPTLSEIWRTAPYLYRGQAATMIDVLTTFNLQDKHGVTSNLSQEQIADLAEYVLSIGE